MADDLIQELEEEQRLLHLRKMAVRIGGALAAVLVVCAIAGGIWGWRQHTLHTAQQVAAGRYYEAMQLLNSTANSAAVSGDAQQKAATIFSDIAQHGPKGVRSYAAMYLAELKQQSHDSAAAITLWRQVVADKTTDSSLRSMAQYLLLNAQMNTASKDELKKGYTALVQAGGSWVPLAEEALAVLNLHPGATVSEKAEARRLLGKVQTSPDSGDALRERASMLLQTLGDAG